MSLVREGMPGAAELNLGLAGLCEGQGGCVVLGWVHAAPKCSALLRCSDWLQKSWHHHVRWCSTAPACLRGYTDDLNS